MAKLTHKTAQEVFEQVQKLDPDEREKLIDMLAAETETEFFSSPKIEQAWMDEVRRRRQLHAEGKTHDVPSDKVFADLRRKYL
jgi:hypothetical protein